MKYLCKITRTVWESDEFGDEWKEKTHEFKEMTVDEINTFIEKNPNIKLKVLIPTKTPNPSEEKGCLAKADANGETPEVDNPVPSINKKDELILKSLQLILSDISSRRGNHVIQKELESFLQNGRETDKVEPFDIGQQRCIYAATDILRPELRAEVLKRLKINIEGL